MFFGKEIHRYDTFRASSLDTGYTQAQHLQGFSASQDTLRVSFLHAGRTQVRHLEGFFASHRKYTGTKGLEFLRFTKEVHRYDTFRVSSLDTGYTRARHL